MDDLESSESSSGVIINKTPVIAEAVFDNGYPINAFGPRTDEVILNPELRRQVKWSEVLSACEEFNEQIKESVQKGSISQHYGEMIKHVVLGPLSLEGKVFTDRDEGDRFPEEIKEKSARAQAVIAHAIFYASLSGVSDEECGNIYDMVAIHDNIANSPIGEAQGYKGWWNGVKSLVTVMRTFDEQGYTVYLPNYAQDPDTTPPHENEILMWDVRNGIDLMAQDAYGNLLLIDAKGRRHERSVHSTELVLDAIKHYPPIIREHIESLNPASLREAKVIIDTDSLPRLRATDGFEGGRFELSGFAHLSNAESIGIIEEVTAH